jgi:hypothetical protein
MGSEGVLGGHFNGFEAGSGWMQRAYRAGRAEIAGMLARAWTKGDTEGVLNIQGVGLGFKRTGRRGTSAMALQVFVGRKERLDRVVPSCRVPMMAGGLPTDVIEQGEAWVSMGAPAAHNSPSWPIVGGSSIGVDGARNHGTAGCVVVDGAGTKYVLTCNHVLSQGLNPTKGDRVSQPGCASDRYEASKALVFGSVDRFTPIVYEESEGPAVTESPAPNTMDVAVVRIDPRMGRRGPIAAALERDVRPEIVNVGTPRGSCVPAWRFTHEVLTCKSGATTGVRYARITSWPLAHVVKYEKGGVERRARFDGLIGVHLWRWFSRYAASGDSGSLVLEENSKRPIGLLMARCRESKLALVCPIEAYLREQGLRVWTGA